MNNYILNNENNFEFFEILYLIIDKMKYNELLSILSRLKNDIFLNKISTMEISIRVLDFKIEKIIINNDYNEINIIKMKLDELLDIFINSDNYNKLKISDDKENTLAILLQELLSIILQITSLNNKEYLKYFEKFISFIETKKKDKNLVTRIFKTFFFQLYEIFLAENLIQSSFYLFFSVFNQKLLILQAQKGHFVLLYAIRMIVKSLNVKYLIMQFTLILT
jgi:hypothetical protein